MMTDKQILFKYGGKGLDQVPEDIRARIERKPRLRAQFMAQAKVASLLSLKRYELQDPAMEGRLSHRLMLRIRNGDFPIEEPSASFLLPEWVRMLAVVIIMLGLSVMTHREMLSSEKPVPVASRTPATSTESVLFTSGESFTLRHIDPFTTVVGISPSDSSLPSLAFSSSDPLMAEPFMLPGTMNTNRQDRASGLLPVRHPLP